MSYYGYVERKPEDVQVNWGEISQGIVKSVKDWEKGREDLREKLDKETRETQKAISETPEVRDESASRFILNASTVAATKLSDLNKMLKSNKITPKEYTLRRANINSDMTEFYAFVKGFDQAYKNKTDLLNSGNMSVVEERDTQKVLEMLKGGLSNLKPEFDETGTLLLKTEDGTKSMRDVFKMGTFSYKKKDLLSEFQKLGSQVAAVDKGYKSSGRLNEEGKSMIETKINAALSNKFDVADILNDAGHTNLFTVDGREVKITEDGMSKARQILKNAAYSAMGIKVDTPSSSGASSGDRPDKQPTEKQRESYQFGQALRNLSNPGDAVYVANQIGAKSIIYNNPVLTIVTDKGTEKVNLSPNQVADYLMKRTKLDQEYVRIGIGGSSSVGSINYKGAAPDYKGAAPEKVNPMTMYKTTNEDGDKVELDKEIMYNAVVDMKNKYPDFADVFEFKDDKIRMKLRDDKGTLVWMSAKNIAQLNNLVKRFNAQYAK